MMKYENYTWDICNMEDLMQVYYEIDIIRDTYENVNIVEVHNNDGQVIAVMLEVY